MLAIDVRAALNAGTVSTAYNDRNGTTSATYTLVVAAPPGGGTGDVPGTSRLFLPLDFSHAPSDWEGPGQWCTLGDIVPGVEYSLQGLLTAGGVLRVHTCERTGGSQSDRQLRVVAPQPLTSVTVLVTCGGVKPTVTYEVRGRERDVGACCRAGAGAGNRQSTLGAQPQGGASEWCSRAWKVHWLPGGARVVGGLAKVLPRHSCEERPPLRPH